MSYYIPRSHPLESDLEIDLHGVTAAEAKIILDELLENCMRPAIVDIIVGVGKNSELGPVLPLVVKKYLAEHSLTCEENKRGTIRTRLV